MHAILSCRRHAHLHFCLPKKGRANIGLTLLNEACVSDHVDSTDYPCIRVHEGSRKAEQEIARLVGLAVAVQPRKTPPGRATRRDERTPNVSESPLSPPEPENAPMRARAVPVAVGKLISPVLQTTLPCCPAYTSNVGACHTLAPVSSKQTYG